MITQSYSLQEMSSFPQKNKIKLLTTLLQLKHNMFLYISGVLESNVTIGCVQIKRAIGLLSAATAIFSFSRAGNTQMASS